MTDTEQEMLADLVADLVKNHPPFALCEDRPWDSALWTDLATTGLTAIGDDDARASVPTAIDVIAHLARGAAAVPLAEHALVARPMLAAAGLTVPPADEVTTFALGELRGTPGPAGTWLVSGRASSPWLSVAEHTVLVADVCGGAVLALASPADLDIRPGVNAAGEPRNTVLADSVRVRGVQVSNKFIRDMRERYALARAAQMFGALREILLLSLRYAQEREQFGRNIGRFQAIQFMIAEITEEVALVAASVHSAANAVAIARPDAAALVAASKINASAAVGPVARHAHQIHGAIGFTQEYGLHHLTRRCWSWRDEAGAELAQGRALSRALVPDAQPGTFWAHLTGTGPFLTQPGQDAVVPDLGRVL